MTACERCLADTDCTTGSWFNLQMICMSCSSEENSHPAIGVAKGLDNAAVLSGDMNYVGMGLPADLKEKYAREHCACTNKRTISGNRCMDCHLPLKPRS